MSNEPAVMLAAVEGPLDPDAQAVIDVTYELFAKELQWPTFYEIDRRLVKLRGPGFRTGQLVASLKPGVMRGSSLRTYPWESDRLQITLAGLTHCEKALPDVQTFIQLVRFCTQYEAAADAAPGETAVTVGREQVIDALSQYEFLSLNSLDRAFILANAENWGCGGSSGTPGQDWTIFLRMHVRWFASVDSVESFYQAQRDWFRAIDLGSPPDQVEPAADIREPRSDTNASTYVHPGVIDMVRNASRSSSWNIDKLVALLEELNSNYAAGQEFAAHMLLRAILDHVPPIFGVTKFSQIINSGGIGRTDKGYLSDIARVRTQSDDALHRQIDEYGHLLRLADLPSAAGINALLRLCAVAMAKATANPDADATSPPPRPSGEPDRAVI